MNLHRFAINVASCFAALLLLAGSLPGMPTSDFVGGDGDCIGEKTVFCATGGGLGAVCDKLKVECLPDQDSGWDECTDGEGNVSSACSADPDCTSDKHAKREGPSCTDE